MFDGIDGVGKTTQLKLVEADLRANGWDVLVLRNLGGTEIGEQLREVLLSPTPRPNLTDMYASVAIQEALLERIAEARQAGQVVLMDRGPLSLGAYCAYGFGIDAAVVAPFVKQGMESIKPELTIIYNGDVKTANNRARAASEHNDFYENQPLDYFQRVQQGYENLGKEYSAVFIDALRSISDVRADTSSVVTSLLIS